MRYSHKEPVREIAQGMLVSTQFQHFIPEVAAESSPATTHMHVSSPAYDYHLDDIDLSYPVDVAETSQAGTIPAITVPVSSFTRATHERFLLP